MAKFARHPKLQKAKTHEMIGDLYEFFASTKNKIEVAKILTDLLGPEELEMIAKRLKVAEMLLDDYTYQDIQKELKVSPATIARVERWLKRSGEGYRMVIERMKKNRKHNHNFKQPTKFNILKKKYPLYFWPQSLLQYWINNSTQREKEDMHNILNKLVDKKEINSELAKMLKSDLKIRGKK